MKVNLLIGGLLLVAPLSMTMVGCMGGGGVAPDSEEPNIIVSEFALSPSTPVRGRPVEVRVGVYNDGTVPAGPYRVEWYPGENYSDPACSWNVSGNNPGGGRILNCTFSGYPSRYASLRTKVIVDTGNNVAESNESDNTRSMEIRVVE